MSHQRPSRRRLLMGAALVGCLLSVSMVSAGGKAPVPAETDRTPSIGNAARGARLVAQYQCGACHVIPGIAAARGGTGPSLQDFGARSYIAGRIPNRADWLVAWLQQPSALVPGTTMPDMGVPLQDARDMAAWLDTLR
ncbi:c-type cytochrome [Xylophilus sp. GOD-11R]|uniref:c-type cytochrome n=1 Tax=Xylophilus sp. GOD-11R TaxID=3089814 RepID=UPI00298C53EE|nr:c-type cytochrome [Xylophilus sp. GOD-11R]WPB55849.1 c-type cytochrome [Xylophilus sp. GOD-11R]